MPRLGQRHPPVRGREERNRLVVENRRLSFFAARMWAEKLRLDSEEARAECDLALINAAELWRPDRGKTFAGYAVRAMFHQLLNYAQKQRRHRPASNLAEALDYHVDARQSDPAEEAAEKDELEVHLSRLYEMVGRLDRRAQLVMLARAAGDTYDCIAERLRVSRQRIQQIEQQARKRLMELLRVG